MERSVAKKNQRDHVAASCGISCGETSQARPIHYRILGLILPSLSLFHLNRTDKLFLSLRRSSAASYLVSVPPVFCLPSINEAPCWFAGDFRTQTPPVFCDLVGSLGSGAAGGSCQMVLTHLNVALLASHRENDRRRAAGEKMAAGSKRLCRWTEMETPASGGTTSAPLLQVQTSIFPSRRGRSPNKHKHSFPTCCAAFVCYTTCDHTLFFFFC